MLDKLYLSGNEPGSLDLLCSRLNKGSSVLRDRYYSDARRLTIGEGQHIVVKTKPNHSLIPFLRIELNPSQFLSYSKMIGAINEIIDPSTLTIKRIDYKSDIHAGYEEVYKLIDVKYKTGSQKFFGAKPTGCYFGRGTNQVLVYDKSPKNAPNSITRIEVRERKNNVSIQHISLIPTLLSFNPFKSIRLMSLSPPPERGSPKAYNILREHLIGDCLFMARKKLSKGNNFSKTYEKYLTPSPDSHKILDNFHQELKRFIEEV